MPRIVEAPLVESDLLEIWLYIAADNQTAADRLLDQMDAGIRRLAKSPRLGIARPELGPHVRSFPIGRYLIYYRPNLSRHRNPPRSQRISRYYDADLIR